MEITKILEALGKHILELEKEISYRDTKIRILEGEIEELKKKDEK